MPGRARDLCRAEYTGTRNITREHSCVDTGAINAACRLKLVLVNPPEHFTYNIVTIHCSSAWAGRRKGMTMTRGLVQVGEEHPAVAVLLFGSRKIEPLRKIRVKWTKEAKNG